MTSEPTVGPTVTMHVRCQCGTDMIAGPRGGSTQNFYCTDRAHCRQGWNLMIRDGRILFSQPIGEVDGARYTLYDI